MITFAITSSNLSLVSPITSNVDRVFDVNGEVHFTTKSHPSVAIKVPDPELVKELLLEKAPVVIAPDSDVTDGYTVELKPIPEVTVPITRSPRSGSPSEMSRHNRQRHSVVA